MTRLLSTTVLALALTTSTFALTSASVLRIVRFDMGGARGDGMDGGSFGVTSFGGGKLKLQICRREECCTTGYLNTRDDNWERGETNYFVGRQLGNCQNFPLGDISDGDISVTLRHKGDDGLRVADIGLFSALPPAMATLSYHCSVGVKIDEDETYTTSCVQSRHPEQEPADDGTAPLCNGHAHFCRLPFDQYTFAGAHNSGTGQSDSRALDCVAKNHDLDVREQLDFGLRFFDLDVIYSKANLGCHGLDVGHGKLASAGLYQCYGSLAKYLSQMRAWLLDQPGQVVVLYFGEITYEREAFPRLVDALRRTFPIGGNVTLNRAFKRTGSWPTLGEAVDTGARVFVFARTDLVDADGMDDVVREIKVASKDPAGEDEVKNGEARREKAVTVLSTFGHGSVGSDCSGVVTTARRSCRRNPHAQLTKVSVFGTFGSAGALTGSGLCTWDVARKCNANIRSAVRACLESKDHVNFVQTDFPNYSGGPGALSLVEQVHLLNVRTTLYESQDGSRGRRAATADAGLVPWAVAAIKGARGL